MVSQVFSLSFSHSMGGVKRTCLYSLKFGHVASNFLLMISLFALNIFRYLGIFGNVTTKYVDNITQYDLEEFIFSSTNKDN